MMLDCTIAHHVPLTMMRAVDPGSFQPKIGFKTRYGLSANPVVGAGTGALTPNTNEYFRNFAVANIG